MPTSNLFKPKSKKTYSWLTCPNCGKGVFLEAKTGKQLKEEKK